MNLTKWFAMLIVTLALTGFVMAETNDTNTNDTQGQALSVRYDHLQCKVAFTNTQIDLFDKYVSTIDQTANKDKLVSDMTTLKTLADSKNKDGFDSYVTETIQPDMKKASEDLTVAKKNFRQYNLTNESRTAFITELKDAKDTYAACVSDKELKMANVMEKHMENWNRQLENINEKMNKKNITTADVLRIVSEIEARNTKLKELIQAGNITTIKEFMKAYQDSQLHYAARFEIARLEGYKNKLGPLAEKYNMSLDDINAKIANAQQYAQEGHKYGEGERKQVWEDIKNIGKDMQQTAKDINAERIKERQNNKTERQQQIGQKPPKMLGREGRGPGNINNSNNTNNDEGQ